MLPGPSEHASLITQVTRQRPCPGDHPYLWVGICSLGLNTRPVRFEQKRAGGQAGKHADPVGQTAPFSFFSQPRTLGDHMGPNGVGDEGVPPKTVGGRGNGGDKRSRQDAARQ